MFSAPVTPTPFHSLVTAPRGLRQLLALIGLVRRSWRRPLDIIGAAS